MAGVINFVEQQRQVMLYDYLVYVAGVDISAYVKDLSIFYQDRNGQNSVDIVLTNPFDQWLMTTANLAGNWRVTSDRYSEKAKYQIWQNKRQFCRALAIKNAGSLPSIVPLGSTAAITSVLELNPEIEAALQQKTKQGFLERYSFGPGSCIFSKFDTIKVFIKNPYDPSTADRWFPAFTGTVENHPFTTDFVMGDSSVHLMGYDIKATLQGMRIDTNAYNSNMYAAADNKADIASQQAVFDADAAGFFADFFPQGEPTFANVFAELSFVDTISLITTGQYNWVKDSTHPVKGQTGFGIGFFEPGQVVRYGAKGNPGLTGKYTSNLEQWDNLCLFGDTSGSQFWTYQQCNQVGTNSFWNSAYSPLYGKVHWLIPADGLEITNSILATTDGQSNIMASPDWTNRYALVSQICSQMDYEWTISGNGDMIFEFPMYDFFPDVFGNNQSLYSVDMHAENEDVSDEGGELISALETDGNSTNMAQQGAIQAIKSTAAGLAVQGAMRAVAYSNVLASKIGARVASKSITGVQTLEGLKKVTLIEFQKRLADANKLSFNFSYRPYLRPNRPLLHKTRERIGKITSVKLNIPSLKPGTISVGLHCVRTPLWAYDPNTGTNRVFYQHIVGGPNMPLSYNSTYEGTGGQTTPTTNPGDPLQGISLRAAYSQGNQGSKPGQ